MKFIAKCWTPPAAALLIVTISLSACAREASETFIPCPPIVVYSAVEQTRAADEVEALSDGPMVVRMLYDYAVRRNQARACS